MQHPSPFSSPLRGMTAMRHFFALLACGIVALVQLCIRRWLLVPLILEPEGMHELLEQIPERRLSSAEKQELQRDGMLLVRGIITNMDLLENLAKAFWPHVSLQNARHVKPWRFNGALLALLRDGPISALAADALGMDAVSIDTAPIFGTRGEPHHYTGRYHIDTPIEFPHKLISIWFAIQDAPHGLEIIRGSNHVRGDIQQKCNMTMQFGEQRGGKMLDVTCTEKFVKEQLAPKVGYPAHWWADLRAGDGILFDGNTTHRGIGWPSPRLTVAIRYKEGKPGLCDDRGEQLTVYPRFPGRLGCVRPQFLPRPHRTWPWLRDDLPNGKDWASRALRQATRALHKIVYFPQDMAQLAMS